MMHVLVLRPEPGATATVKRARGLGLNAIAVPLFEIEELDWEAPDADKFDGLLLTSANAAGGVRDRLRDLPVYAVGEATADAARAAGLSVAAVGDSGVDRLLRAIDPKLNLLHLCGEDRRVPSNPRQRITPIAVYRAKAIQDPDLNAADGAVALIHSPGAAVRLSELVRRRDLTSIAAISPAAAQAAGAGWAAVESASEPNDDALLALAARLCNNSRP